MATAFATALLTLSSLVTSVSTKMASPPASRTQASVARPNSGFNSAIMTLAPASANRRAAALAIPEPAPVMKATFPSKSLIGQLSFGCGFHQVQLSDRSEFLQASLDDGQGIINFILANRERRREP